MPNGRYDMDEKENMMKKISRRMSLCMGVTLSFFLSLIGTATSGHFSVPGWIISFIISTIISLIIGFLVPVKKVSDNACQKFNMQPGKLSTRCFESLISDLIYTPIITFCMVLFAYLMATRQGAPLHFLPMFLSSLIICLITGFVLIFIFMPLYMKLIIGKAQKPE